MTGRLYTDILVSDRDSKIEGNYAVGITAQEVVTPAIYCSYVFLAVEVTKTATFNSHAVRGLATAVMAALNSHHPCVTVYTDLNDRWWILWYVGGQGNKFAHLHNLSRTQAIHLIRSWVNYNINHVQGQPDVSRIRKTPPPPFHDIKRLTRNTTGNIGIIQ